MQHACTADQCDAQELFFFIKLPSNFIFFLFSGFTLNTGWQAATERKNALSTYVCTLFPCITRCIFYRRMCCYHARSLLHTRFMLDVIFYSAHHPTRVLLQTYRSFPWHFFHALFQDTQIAPRFTHVYLLPHTHIAICASPKYISKRICICTAAQENKVYVLLLLLFVNPNIKHVHQTAALKLLQFICQRASWLLSSLTLLIFSQLLPRFSFCWSSTMLLRQFLWILLLLFGQSVAPQLYSFVLSFQICHYFCKISIASVFRFFMSF